MTPIPLLLACALLSFLLTAGVRALARRANLIDIPNERSSHTIPTPRGGGVAIVGSMTLGLYWLAAGDMTPAIVPAGLLPALLLVALVGLIDDRWQLSAWVRLASHFAAAGWILWQLGPLPPVPMPGGAWDLGWLAIPLALLYLVWAINFFNFMDGIDGIAASEAILVGLGGAALNLMHLGAAGWPGPALLACCCLGFLVWNWPPARIFMGDAGSGFLGLAIGAMTVGYACLAPVLFWGWMILQGCFMVDATVTLLRRIRRGQRAMQPHRSHAYQFAARRYGRHQPVTMGYAAITAFWLMPVATLVVAGLLSGLVGLVLAYMPLIGLAYHFKAGAAEQQ
jgi:Fuc2NAc and GlcNAc transferase